MFAADVDDRLAAGDVGDGGVQVAEGVSERVGGGSLLVRQGNQKPLVGAEPEGGKVAAFHDGIRRQGQAGAQHPLQGSAKGGFGRVAP